MGKKKKTKKNASGDLTELGQHKHEAAPGARVTPEAAARAKGARFLSSDGLPAASLVF